MPSEREMNCFSEGEKLEKKGFALLEGGEKEDAENTLLRASYHFLMCGALEHAKGTLAKLSEHYGNQVYTNTLKNLNYLKESRMLVDLLRGDYEYEDGGGIEKLDVLDMFMRETTDGKCVNRASERWHKSASKNRLYDGADAHNHYNVKIVYGTGLRELLKGSNLEEEQAKALANFVMLNPNYAIEARKKIYGLQ